jgi:N4-(beta-N-acetylglucosaminyl)-L-asparaginase
MYAIIGTWKMCYAGVKDAFKMLERGSRAHEAIAHAVMAVEDDPRYTSVGFGGLPGRDGRVTLDAAFMNGRTLRYGGVIGVEHVQNPILAAIKLSERKMNCLLAGPGAEDFAVSAGLKLRDMHTESAVRRWREAIQKEAGTSEAYRGHDTVCVLALDDSGDLCVGVSTSGLFMKVPGRVGDSPIIGSGFYCDARYGGAAATGLGEDIMRGCLSRDAVSLMRDGMTPQEACDTALYRLRARMRELDDADGGMSLIALNPEGQFGASTTIDLFPFAVAREGKGAALYAAGQGETASTVRRVADEEADRLASD